jgi:Zn-dependent protease
MPDSPEILMQIRDGVVYLIALILSISVHEFGHAFIADKLGDPLPRAQGRVTLNPIAHIDPIGTLLMPLFQIFADARVLGWGKPVQVSLSARHMSRRFSMKINHLFIAIAGPMMNIIFALVLSVLFLVLLRFGGVSTLPFVTYVGYVISMNIGLAFFNLIPCPPLDGGAVLHGILPRDLEFISETLQKFGFVILLALLLSGGLRYFMIPARWASDWWMAHLISWVAS